MGVGSTGILLLLLTSTLLGDDEKVFIWSLDTKEIIHTLADCNQRWGQVTVLHWCELDQTSYLFIGTGRGKILIYAVGGNGKFQEVTCMQAFDRGVPVEAACYSAEQRKLAVTSHSGELTVYDMSKEGKGNHCSCF